MSTFLKHFLSNKKRVAEEQAAKINSELKAKKTAPKKAAAKKAAPKKTVKKATTKV